MPQMVVEGISSLVAKVQDHKRSHTPKWKVWVGYEAEYAIFVHENLQAHHPVGQAKFLEEPARVATPHMQAILTNALRAGATIDEAMYAAGLFLQGESQRLCPVDTGFLRNSAFTLVENL